MSRTDAFQVEGTIVEVLPNKTCRVELSNGHRLTGFLTGKSRPGFARLTVGERVLLALSPFDLSEGRIILESK